MQSFLFSSPWLRLPPRVSDPHTEIRSSTNRVPTSAYTRAYTRSCCLAHTAIGVANRPRCTRVHACQLRAYTRAGVRVPRCVDGAQLYKQARLCFHRKHTELQSPDVTLYRLLAVSGQSSSPQPLDLALLAKKGARARSLPTK